MENAKVYEKQEMERKRGMTARKKGSVETERKEECGSLAEGKGRADGC